jgi:hypothetical protein
MRLETEETGIKGNSDDTSILLAELGYECCYRKALRMKILDKNSIGILCHELMYLYNGSILKRLIKLDLRFVSSSNYNGLINIKNEVHRQRSL